MQLLKVPLKNLVRMLRASGELVLHRPVVGRIEHGQHGAADQLVRGIAQLLRAESIDGQHHSIRSKSE